MTYFDLQVNGYSGIDFNGEALNAADLERLCQTLTEQGVDGILATIITDSIERMEQRLQRLAKLLKQNPSLQRTIRGIHIEGPFINSQPGYRGAHPADAIIPANDIVMKRLLAAAGGFTRLVTLAPEHDSHLRVTRMLSDSNIVVSAGHTNASQRELMEAIDAGLTMFTHLGNGCPASLPRHDNIIQRVLSLRDKLWLCFIADGVHIPFFALRNYLDLVGCEKAIVVTDAIVAANLGPGRYHFGRWDLDIGTDLVARSPDDSHLVGSTVTMPKTYLNLTRTLGLSIDEARMMLERNPRAAMRKALCAPPS